jgi:uncharacterized membrane protein
MDLRTKKIAENAIVAAVYFVVTLICTPFSFGLVQFRLSEALMILCFFRKDFVIGLTIGCLLSNLSMSASVLGSTGWIDVLVGTGATLLSGLLMPYCKRIFIATLMPVIFNAVIVGLELTYAFELGNIWVCMGFVALGEFVVISIFGYVAILIIRKRYQNFDKIIDANCNLDAKW